MFLEFVKAAEVDIFGFTVLLIVFFSSFRRQERNCFNYKVFITMITIVMIELVLEAMMFFVTLADSPVITNLNYILNVSYFILNPLPPLFWAIYTHYQIYDEVDKAKGIARLLLLLVIINSVILIFTLKVPVIFPYTGSYGIFSTAGICLSFVLYSIYLTLTNYKKINKNRFIALLFFSLFTIIGSLIDMAITDLSTLWPSVIVALLYIYINIQKQREDTDSLTRLYNRRKFDDFFEKKVNESRLNRSFSLIMIDLDDFKQINDTYGHTQGDRSLEDAGNIISNSTSKTDFIARYAGDEFVIILDSWETEILESVVDKIRKNLAIYNESSFIPLSFSIGYDWYKPGSNMKPRDFFKSVDSLMYMDKRNRSC